MRLRALVAMTGKTDDDQCWGSNVVYDGGGFCDECVTELQEQSVQDMLPKLQGLSARPAKERREKRNHVVAGPSLDQRDDVEQLMGHQAVAYVTKILYTNEAIFTESGRRESLKEYFILREKAVLAPVELDSIESAALVAKGKLILRLKTTLVFKSKQGWLLWKSCCLTSTCLFDATQHCTTCGLRSRRRPRRVSYPRERRRTGE